ncbi:hypothetical protein TNCV_643361 [Trichonephila clavipes]|nr:hypothetical protein TNCV_643361 [Trichonephila clavipes]
MSSGPVAQLCPASGVCPVARWRNSALRRLYVQWPGGGTLPYVGYMSRAQWQNSVLCQIMYSCRVAELFPTSGVCPVIRRQISDLRLGYVQWQGDKKLSRVRDMSRSPMAETCPVSGVCPGVEWYNSILFQRYIQWWGDRTLSNVRGMSSGGVTEPCQTSGGPVAECPASGVQLPGGRTPSFGGVCLVTGWQNSFLRERYVQWPGGKPLYCVTGMSSGSVAELCPAGVCPVAQWQNLVQRLRYVQ